MERMDMSKIITVKQLDEIYYQPGCAVKVKEPVKGGYRTLNGWVVDNFKHHILVKIDTVDAFYVMSVNKIDLAQGIYRIQEVV